MPILKIIAGLALAFDAVGLLFVLFAGVALLSSYFTSDKEKGVYALKNKTYNLLRRHFAHRIIIALDFFIVGDLLKIVVASTTESLIQLLIIVIIRTILNHFLMEGNKK